MAMYVGDEPHPYWALFANADSPTSSDTAIAYATVYHIIAKDHTVFEVIDAMKRASGDQNWVVETADATKKTYTDHYFEELSRLLTESAEALKTPSEPKVAEVATEDSDHLRRAGHTSIRPPITPSRLPLADPPILGPTVNKRAPNAATPSSAEDNRTTPSADLEEGCRATSRSRRLVVRCRFSVRQRQRGCARASADVAPDNGNGASRHGIREHHD
jgi:hypothetical protein